MVKSSDESFLNYIWGNCYIFAYRFAGTNRASVPVNWNAAHVLSYDLLILNPSFHKNNRSLKSEGAVKFML